MPPRANDNCNILYAHFCLCQHFRNPEQIEKRTLIRGKMKRRRRPQETIEKCGRGRPSTYSNGITSAQTKCPLYANFAVLSGEVGVQARTFHASNPRRSCAQLSHMRVCLHTEHARAKTVSVYHLLERYIHYGVSAWLGLVTFFPRFASTQTHRYKVLHHL